MFLSSLLSWASSPSQARRAPRQRPFGHGLKTRPRRKPFYIAPVPAFSARSCSDDLSLDELLDVTDYAPISSAISVENDTNVNPGPSAAAIRIVEAPVFFTEHCY